MDDRHLVGLVVACRWGDNQLHPRRTLIRHRHTSVIACVVPAGVTSERPDSQLHFRTHVLILTRPGDIEKGVRPHRVTNGPDDRGPAGPRQRWQTESMATESVWDYPRPPRLEPTPREVRVMHHGTQIARTTGA